MSVNERPQEEQRAESVARGMINGIIDSLESKLRSENEANVENKTATYDYGLLNRLVEIRDQISNEAGNHKLLERSRDEWKKTARKNMEKAEKAERALKEIDVKNIGDTSISDAIAIIPICEDAASEIVQDETWEYAVQAYGSKLLAKLDELVNREFDVEVEIPVTHMVTVRVRTTDPNTAHDRAWDLVAHEDLVHVPYAETVAEAEDAEVLDIEAPRIGAIHAGNVREVKRRR